MAGPVDRRQALTTRQSQQRQRQQPPQQAASLTPITVSIPRYRFNNDIYWYIIKCQMEDGRHWELSRCYTDFYDFQIALLERFPEEAGNKSRPRTIPFMPGPVEHVTGAISNSRRHDLHEYICEIISMPQHISKCTLVRKLFTPRYDDCEVNPTTGEVHLKVVEEQEDVVSRVHPPKGSMLTGRPRSTN